MIYLLASMKGGSGKTTISTGLAYFLAKKSSTLIVDTDPQRSSMSWYAARQKEDKNLAVTSLIEPEILKKQIPIFSKKFQNIVIDGAKNDICNAITLFYADAVIIPIYLSPLDLWAGKNFMERISQARTMKPALKAMFVLNNWNDRASVASSVIEALKSDPDMSALPILNHKLSRRLAYSNSMFEGKTALESDNAKAKSEFSAVLKEIIETTKK